MIFKEHYDLRGKHAFLSASKYHWINYDEERLLISYENALAAQRGTELHDIASRLIKYGLKLKGTKATLSQYVNDSIGFRMIPEQVLYYSPFCFGTADAISFDERKRRLRIFDLKTGSTPASMSQLKVYAAIFCLEYGYKPQEIEIELRLYQLDDVVIEEPDPDEILEIMNKIIIFDKLLEKQEVEGLR